MSWVFHPIVRVVKGVTLERLLGLLEASSACVPYSMFIALPPSCPTRISEQTSSCWRR